MRGVTVYQSVLRSRPPGLELRVEARHRQCTGAGRSDVSDFRLAAWRKDAHGPEPSILGESVDFYVRYDGRIPMTNEVYEVPMGDGNSGDYIEEIYKMKCHGNILKYVQRRAAVLPSFG